MRIVDAQVHIWSGGAPSGLHRKIPSFTAEELLAEMGAAGADAAMIQPPVSWDPGSNDLAVAAARRWPERFFWGTDLTRMPCSYRECMTMFTEELPWLSGGDLELVMGRAVCDWIGWALPFD